MAFATTETSSTFCATAEAAQASHELPEVFDDEVRVAAAAHVQLAAQHFRADRAIGQELGAEGERRA